MNGFELSDGSLPDPQKQRLPPVIKPQPEDDSEAPICSNNRRGSLSTNQTETTEKYELEESSEFLQPVDSAPIIVDEDDYQALEDIKTKLHVPPSNTHVTYDRVPWTLKIRKEVFSPSETINSPLAINLCFCQIVTDVFSPLCIRLSPEDRSRMKTLLDEYNISLKNVFGNQHKLSTKKNIIDMAKEFPTYFARYFALSSNLNGFGLFKYLFVISNRLYPTTQPTGDAQYLAISHSGVRLVRREKSIPTDYLQASKMPTGN